ncbi:MAG TPA: MarC family protein [Amaricoccus sp.]|uniref:MarC family protein n=1 Tax=Amaricoccus sp. TaxID=1872485 RepID=UPI001D7AA013|nr:MarC family protein [Amaricoccus sp.]MCB1372343.1 MarC family protein [Paracoccaceae bacterium]MCC0066634.1 MarC family protein [Rhodovulum sp.]MCB1373995.1 MarC family protein [Paracoccaceae bacterium]HPG22147.1 MarC family protein [Amaricoccus sp.]HRW15550.1 MarC family protein [Amaricoccus sp.]
MTPDLFLTAFVTLFVIIDPIGLVPLFVALTQGMSSAERRRVGFRAIAVGFFLLAAFGIAGESLLALIGIGMPAFRISGGMLLFLMAVDMLFERRSERREKQTATQPPDPSVFPLAMPLIAGPGALATMILLSSQNNGDPMAILTINAAMAAVLALSLILFRAGGLLERALGHTGIVVVTRLLGILLAALSVQFVLDGIRDLGLIGA